MSQHPKFLKDTGVKKFRKNGLVFARDLDTAKNWEQENKTSYHLTACHKNGCGRTVEFKKVGNKYVYHCLECGNTEECPQGKHFAGF